VEPPHGLLVHLDTMYRISPNQLDVKEVCSQFFLICYREQNILLWISELFAHLDMIPYPVVPVTATIKGGHLLEGRESLIS